MSSIKCIGAYIVSKNVLRTSQNTQIMLYSIQNLHKWMVHYFELSTSSNFKHQPDFQELRSFVHFLTYFIKKNND